MTNRWKKVATVTDFIFLGSQIIVDGDWSHEIERCLLLGRKTTRMWELNHKEVWTLKSYAFEFWCWRKHLRVLWTARRSNQSILKEINFEYSLEESMLKLQSFGHLIWRADSLEKTLMLGKTEGRRRRGQQRMRWLHSITDSMDMNLGQLQETVKDRKAWWAVVHGVSKSRTRLSSWTEQKQRQLFSFGQSVHLLNLQFPHLSSRGNNSTRVMGLFREWCIASIDWVAQCLPQNTYPLSVTLIFKNGNSVVICSKCLSVMLMAFFKKVSNICCWTSTIF